MRVCAVSTSRFIATSILTVLTGHVSSAHAQTDEGLFVASRFPELIAILLCALALGGAALWVKRHGVPQLRSLPPMDAISDAVGRATEQGSPVVYITGWGGDMARPTTMASMVILSEVAQRTAEYNCRLLFPSHDPLVVSVAQETVSNAASVAGRPDWYKPDDLAFVSQSQLGYAAAVDGIMAREHPGAVFLLGTFEGEALILAETAHQTGAVTIAGTDSTIQLSFLLVACDFTLIGEELFAASGMIAGDKAITAAVLGQDWLKYLIVGMLIVGAGLLALWNIDVSGWLAQ
jgi:hypothetical protein